MSGKRKQPFTSPRSTSKGGPLRIFRTESSIETMHPTTCLLSPAVWNLGKSCLPFVDWIMCRLWQMQNRVMSILRCESVSTVVPIWPTVQHLVVNLMFVFWVVFELLSCWYCCGGQTDFADSCLSSWCCRLCGYGCGCAFAIGYRSCCCRCCSCCCCCCCCWWWCCRGCFSHLEFCFQSYPRSESLNWQTSQLKKATPSFMCVFDLVWPPFWQKTRKCLFPQKSFFVSCIVQLPTVQWAEISTWKIMDNWQLGDL